MPDRKRKIIAERYEVIREIGSGGMAVVYKARDTSLNKEVAVKMLRPELMTGEGMMRFQMEAKTASMLSHPNLIRTLDFGITSDAQPYLVMDFVSGTTLSDFIEEKTRLPISQAAGIFIQICDAMALAHSQGVLHRDLKSSNIMLTQLDSAQPKAFVLDFGLAKRVEDPGLTRTGKLIGSPRYMSPEHARGEELDTRADIYSMGCIMFETLTGRPPISGETVLDTIMKQTTELPPTLAEKCPDAEFSQAVEAIVATCLEKDPNQRFQSMAELKQSIQSLREFRATQSNTREIKMAIPEPTALDSPPIVLAPAFSRRFILSCVTLLVVVGGVGLLVAPMVPELIDVIHPSKDNEVTVPVPPHTELMLGAEDEPILPSNVGWTIMPWNDGVPWYKKFGVDEEDFVDYQTFHKYGYISLWKERATASRLRFLQKAQLKGLSLYECHGLSDNEVKIASEMKTLEVLLIDKNPNLTDKALRSVYDLKNLKILSMERDFFTDQAFQGIEQLQNLEVLYLGRMDNFHGYGLKYIQKLSKLKKLRIDRSPVRPGTLGLIGQLKNLRVLTVEGCRVTNEDAIEFSKLPNLEILNVSNTKLTEEGFKTLTAMHSLKHLFVGENLDENQVSRKSLENARKTTSISIVEADTPSVDNYLNYKYANEQI